MLFQTSAIKRPQLQDSQKCLFFSNLFTGRKVEGRIKIKRITALQNKVPSKRVDLVLFWPKAPYFSLGPAWAIQGANIVTCDFYQEARTWFFTTGGWSFSPSKYKTYIMYPLKLMGFKENFLSLNWNGLYKVPSHLFQFFISWPHYFRKINVFKRFTVLPLKSRGNSVYSNNPLNLSATDIPEKVAHISPLSNSLQA